MPDNSSSAFLQHASVDDMFDSFQAQGAKLGFFISSLNASDDTKQAFLDVLPCLSLEQIDRLTDMLESRYLHEQTQSIDAELQRELQNIQRQADSASQDADQKALEAIAALTEQSKETTEEGNTDDIAGEADVDKKSAQMLNAFRIAKIQEIEREVKENAAVVKKYRQEQEREKEKNEDEEKAKQIMQNIQIQQI